MERGRPDAVGDLMERGRPDAVGDLISAWSDAGSLSVRSRFALGSLSVRSRFDPGSAGILPASLINSDPL